MDETSKGVPEYSNEELELLERMSRLSRNPDFLALCAWLDDRREKFYDNFARGLAASPNPVNQREVDEKRGFWKCAKWIQRQPAEYAEKRKKYLEAVMKEADEQS